MARLSSGDEPNVRCAAVASALGSDAITSRNRLQAPYASLEQHQQGSALHFHSDQPCLFSIGVITCAGSLTMPTHFTGPKNLPSPDAVLHSPADGLPRIKEVSHDTDHWAARMICPTSSHCCLQLAYTEPERDLLWDETGQPTSQCDNNIIIARGL